MSKNFDVGKTFRSGYDAWLVLEREDNFVLLENLNGRIWCTANVHKAVGEDSESCTPVYSAENSNSVIYFKDRIKQFFDEEVKKMRIQKAAEAEKAAKEKTRMKELADIAENVAKAKNRRNDLIAQFQTACNAKDFANLDAKKLYVITNELSFIDHYLKLTR
jgi:hypothetical protein